ncbi:hypothetical protein CF327_g7775 [Tilletia walkeri]|uniref:Uncharacterized protein n=1 Tax=Tilletia walkeri TaxID=117179 RepID=A0A8X7T1U6_9BASI|nr:hypothetical protein CF327_g7775 [Tilletia walkeri]KAE8264306.1 hypothetical protein A4X09_0g6998 [Tilletia walkeri]
MSLTCEILSKRGRKIRVNIPSWPGTSDPILEVIKEALKDQKHKVDLDDTEYSEYAYLADKSHRLLPLPVATEDVNASMFEGYYRIKSCVIVPMILDHDPDLHGLFYDDEDEDEHNKIEEPVSELSVVATVA